jgi:hypothetical protein
MLGRFFSICSKGLEDFQLYVEQYKILLCGVLEKHSFCSIASQEL